MTKIKHVLFQNKTLKDKRHPVLIRIAHSGKNRYMATGYSASKDEWDEKGMTFSKAYKKNFNLTGPEFEKEKKKLSKMLSNAQDYCEEMQNKKIFNIDKLILKIKNIEESTDFLDFTDRIIKDNQKAGKIGNAVGYQTVYNLVDKFQNGKQLNLTDVDYNWLKDFETWRLEKGNNMNTLSIYLRTIRAILNLAISKGLIEPGFYPFGKGRYQISNSPTIKRAIAKDDIDKIRNIELPENSSMWHARNLFLFSFYCRGMNWVDMAKLKLKNIQSGRITYIRTKTMRKSSKSFSIKINDRIKTILDWYCDGKNADDYIFPIITRDKNPELMRKDIRNNLKTFNKYLRKVAEKCKIEAHLTSYVSRHSWATIAKRMGVELAVISDGLGHADMQVTQTYLDSIESDRIDDANDLIIA